MLKEPFKDEVPEVEEEDVGLDKVETNLPQSPVKTKKRFEDCVTIKSAKSLKTVWQTYRQDKRLADIFVYIQNFKKTNYWAEGRWYQNLKYD